jgi:uncharacterized repeat protein (TIGR03803 family)
MRIQKTFAPIAFSYILALQFLSLFVLSLSLASAAQTLTVLHGFTNGGDGGGPAGTLSLDGSGNLYGTTYIGGAHGVGTVYKLSHRGSGWVLSTLYTFTGGSDGSYPAAGVTIGPNGRLYGTTGRGGNHGCDGGGCGVLYELRPPTTICGALSCPWIQTIVHQFTGGDDGGLPSNGSLVFDSAGNMYGTTQLGGPPNQGTVYKVQHSGGSWIESVLYSFHRDGVDGKMPAAGVILDHAGNLYGTTPYGGLFLNGTAFKLTPQGSGWTEQILQDFPGPEGAMPLAGLILDGAGNLYGATLTGGAGAGGNVYELSPPGSYSNFTELYDFVAFTDNSGPASVPVMDASGNLYGSRAGSISGNDPGSIYKLTNNGGSWTEVTLHNFAGGSDGSNPIGGVTRDSHGNLYGTTFYEGPGGAGMVWEITP